MSRSSFWRVTLAVAGVVCAARFAGATSLRLSPIGIEMPSTQRASALSLMNTGTQPLNVQVRIFKWSQADGVDRLEPTRDMIASPPASTIPPGKTYTVRVARNMVSSVQGESSYRLLIDEIPRPADPDAPGKGVAMVLRTSLPVFVVDKGVASRLAWTASQDAQGLHLVVTNTGSRHARISGLSLQPAGGAPISFGAGLNGYVLAGASRRFDLPATPARALPHLGGAQATLHALDGSATIGAVVTVNGS